MGHSLRRYAAPVGLAAGLCFLLAWVGMQTVAFTDYELEAEPALHALRDGRFMDFLEGLPSYGGSILMRLPFATLPDLWGGGDLALFRSLAVPCIAAGAALALVLWRRAVERGAGRWAGLVVVALCAGNPLTLRALELGHPEELLGGVLCVAALLAAGDRRPLAAGALLGLAVANKPWAALAIAPVLITLPAGHLRAGAMAGAVATAVLAPLVLLGSSAVEETGAVARNSGHIFQPWQVWWFLGDHGQMVTGLYGDKPGFRVPPGWVGHVARPLVVLVPLVLCAVLARRVRGRRWHDGLLLLALVLLLRCLLDPWNFAYYELPFLLALLAWEVHARPGIPAMSLAATLACWVTLEQLVWVASPDVQAAAFLAWSVPVVVAMLVELTAPGRLALPSLQPSARRSSAVSPSPLA